MKNDEIYIVFLTVCIMVVALTAYAINDKLQSCQKQIEVMKNDK